jgi:hypothetical protein
MTGRQATWAGVAVLLVLLGGLAVLLSAPDTGERPAPRPVEVPAPRPVPRAQHIPLRPPPDIEVPDPPRERPPPAEITPDDRRTMNFAVDGVLRAARTECLEPWLDQSASEPGGERPAEFVFDAVLHDGRMVDMGFRSLEREVPADVIECVADKAWYAEWPEWELRGEQRLQRSITVTPRP